MGVKRCKESFAVFVNGSPRVVPAGTLLDESDPLVSGHATLFEDVEAHVAYKQTRVEQATAAPGERRTVRRAPRGKGRGRTVKSEPVKDEAASEGQDKTGEDL